VHNSCTSIYFVSSNTHHRFICWIIDVNFKSDIWIFISSLDHCHLAQVWDQWQALLKTVMQILLSQSARSFLHSWKTVTFLMSILLHGVGTLSYLLLDHKDVKQNSPQVTDVILLNGEFHSIRNHFLLWLIAIQHDCNLYQNLCGD
jgi:hypothetical protein